MKKGKFTKKSILPSYLAIIGVVLALVIAANSVLDAKYVSTKRSDPVAVAKAFYFESDLLKADSVPTYELPVGTTKITFTLKNFTDSLRYAEADIAYEIYLDGVKNQTGTIATGAANTALISLTGLSDGTYTVEAKATAPYTASLKANFTIPVGEKPFDYSVTDQANSPIARLTVWTNDYSGNLTLSWPDGVYPDNTDPKLVNATGNAEAIHFDNDASYTFVFIKQNPGAVYGKNEIKATN